MKNLYFGDCLDVLRKRVETANVDLVYLDPPFNSKRLYNVFLGKAQQIAFDDTWRWHEAVDDFHEVARRGRLSKIMEGFRLIHGDGPTLAYLSYMANRLRECYRVLKPTGLLYLHCDPNMSHSLKLLLDGLFGSDGKFLNEIIWSYRTGGVGKRSYARKHDVLLFYSKSTKYFFKQMKERSYATAHPPGYKSATVLQDETSGRFYTMATVRDVWDINAIGKNSKERLGYPTQKPLALLERVIEVSSGKGYTVLDPFCGCGTTIHAAEKLGRNWIGIDICLNACQVIENRIQEHFGDTLSEVRFDGIPTTIEDAKELAKRNRFAFEKWAVTLIEGMEPNRKQRGDRGIDGRGRVPVQKGNFVDMVAQVKSGKPKPNDIRAFRGAFQQAGAELGIFICFADLVTVGMRDAAASDLYQGVPTMQICTIEDLMNGQQPKLPKWKR